MAAELLATLGFAAMLGVRHGIDADHLAAIDALARWHAAAGKAALARASGVLFALGHGCVIAVAALVAQARPFAVPVWLASFGSAISIGLLVVLGSANLARSLQPDAPARLGPLVALLLRLPLARLPAGSFVTGLLFALSFDTLTIGLWLARAEPAGRGPLALLPPVAFVLGMAICDGLNAVWVTHLVRRSALFASAARRAFSAAVALLTLSVAAVGLARWISAGADLWWSRHDLLLSTAAVTALATAFVVLGARHRRPRPLSTSARRFHVQMLR